MSDHPAEDLMLHPGHLLRRALQAMNLLWDREVSHVITSPQFAALNALYREPDIDQRPLDDGGGGFAALRARTHPNSSRFA
jgi:hypothetical protein